MFLFCESRGRQHGSASAGSSAVTPGRRDSASLGLRAHPVATVFYAKFPACWQSGRMACAKYRAGVAIEWAVLKCVERACSLCVVDTLLRMRAKWRAGRHWEMRSLLKADLLCAAFLSCKFSECDRWCFGTLIALMCARVCCQLILAGLE